jgi:hypothetical protein
MFLPYLLVVYCVTKNGVAVNLCCLDTHRFLLALQQVVVAVIIIFEEKVIAAFHLLLAIFPSSKFLQCRFFVVMVEPTSIVVVRGAGRGRNFGWHLRARANIHQHGICFSQLSILDRAMSFLCRLATFLLLL